MWAWIPTTSTHQGPQPRPGQRKAPSAPQGQEGKARSMLLKQEVQVRFERIVKDQHGNLGKTHITLDGRRCARCGRASGTETTLSGVEQVDLAEFVADACGTKGRHGNGEIGRFGCWPRWSAVWSRPSSPPTSLRPSTAKGGALLGPSLPFRDSPRRSRREKDANDSDRKRR